jgi:hypothetical protein
VDILLGANHPEQNPTQPITGVIKMNTEQIPTPNAVIRIESTSHLDISFYDEFVLFAYTAKGRLKGGNFTIRQDQVRRMTEAATARRNWQSDSGGTLPHLLAWWDHADDQLNIDLIRCEPQIELFGRIILENPVRGEIIDAIKRDLKGLTDD